MAARTTTTALLGAFALGLLVPLGVDAALTIEPITWNVVGLDSNSPTSGPRHFPVGVRVCSAGVAASNVNVALAWDSANPHIGLRPGSLATIGLPSIAANACADAYFEIEVAATAAAFDTARRYHVTATEGATANSASTPQPGELYVEHLVSQARNEVSDVRLNGASIPAGGTMTLVVGGVYDITLVGATATQGYNQLESFVNFPNTIFRVLAVNTTYTADTSIFVASPDDRLYADACGWQNNVASPNYRSCVGGAGGAGSDGKAGGGVSTTYTVQIVGGAGTTQTLNTLIYDFSGSSYHYNGDYAVGARLARIVDPVPPTFAKSFAPSTVTPGGVATLTFAIGNANPGALANVGFTDNLPSVPAQMVVASPASVTTSGCGSATVSAPAGATTIAVSGATVAANGSCTISVRVAAPLAGSYSNTTGPLSVGSTDTGLTASSTLTAASAAAGTGLCGITVAQWTFGTVAAPTLTASTVGAGVGTASISGGNGLTVVTNTTQGSPAASSLRAYGWQNAGPVNTSTSDYLQFAIDTDSYTGVVLSFNATRPNPGPTNSELWYSTDGGATWTLKSAFAVGAASWAGFGPFDFTGQTNATGTTLFRIYGYGANNQNSGSDLSLDQVTFTGCGAAQHPTIAKSFSPNPVTVGSASTLTFALANPNAAPLNGVKFLDTLPAGLEVASPVSALTTCGGSPSWAPTAGATTLAFGQSAGATIPANGSCTATVDVVATATGGKVNISDFVSSTESGVNTGSTGSATATLNVNAVVAPPVLTKQFQPATIAQGTRSILSLTITNTNAATALSGMTFTDVYPGAIANANPLVPLPVDNCGGTLTVAPGGNSIAYSGGVLAAGASCTIEVPVTSSTLGAHVNTSSTVTAAQSATAGAAATATLTVTTPHPAIKLSKKVRVSPSGPWLDTVVAAPGAPLDYQFVVENVGDVAFDSFSVSDPLLAGGGADPAGCTWQTSNLPSLLPALPVASATADPTATCVRGPVNAAAGATQNIATVNAVYGASTYNASDVANALGADPNLSLTKEIATAPLGPWAAAIPGIAPGSSVYYRFTIANNGGLDVTGLSISDPMVSIASCTYVDPLPPAGASLCVVGPVTTAGSPGATVTNTATVNGTSGGNAVADTAQASYTLLPASADVSIVKTPTTAGPYTIGQSIGYTLVVANGGPDTATGVQVTDTPANLAIVAVSGAGCSALPCTIASLSSGASATIDVTTTIVAAGAFDNAATVAANEGDPNPGNNSDSSGNGGVASASADVSVVKTLTTAGPFTVGQSVAYALVVANAGPSTATNLQLTDTPSNLTLLGVSGGGCAGLPCTIASLPPGGSVTIDVTARIDASGAFDNGAGVTAVEPDPVPANNADVAGNGGTAALPSADLFIDKSDSVATVVAGTSTSYAITVTNAGPDAAANVAWNDPLPPGTTFASLTTPGGWACTTPPVGANGVVSCSTASLGVGASATATLSVNVGASQAPGTTLSNTATASSATTDPNPANNASTDTDSVTAIADLSVAKSDGVSVVTPGAVVAYTVTVTNGGPSAVTGAILADAAAAGLAKTAVACSPTPGQCTSGPEVAQLEAGVALPALAPGSTYELLVTATVTAVGGTVTNTATVAPPSGVNDPAPGNNSSSDSDVVTPVVVAADLAITKTDSATQVTAGASTTYTIAVTNHGPDAASGVTLTDPLPASMTFASLSAPAGWTCTTPAVGASGTVTCSIPSLASGATAAFTLGVGVASGTVAGTVITNVAAVTSGTPDPVPANDTASDADTVIAAPVTADLAITKSDGIAQVTPGGSTTYTLVVSNLGPGEVTGALVSDVAPAGLSFGSWTCLVTTAGSGGTVATACGAASGTGNVAASVTMQPGAVITFTVQASVASGASGSLANTGTVVAPAGVTDPVPGNNSATDVDTVAVAIAPSPIPTMSEWALVLMSLALGMLATRSHRVSGRRR